MRYPCPCCGYLVFPDPPGSYEYCPICDWQDDLSQLRFIQTGGANRFSLLEAQQNYIEGGASKPGVRQHIRQPGPDDVRDKDWRSFDPSRDDIEEPRKGVDYGRTYPGDRTLLYYWRPGYWRRQRS